MKKSTLIKKIIAGAVAVILICAIGYFANGLTGNPLSRSAAQRAAQEHVSKTYPGQEFDLAEAEYDFKKGCYRLSVSSRTSKDTYFPLDYGFFGNLMYDGFQDFVTDGRNTLERVSDDYGALTKSIFESNRYSGCYSELENPDGSIKLELDREYDVRQLGGQYGKLYVFVNTDEVSEDSLCTQLLKIKAVFDAENVPFAVIDLSVSGNDDSLSVTGFKYADITDNTLAAAVAENIAENDGLDEKQQQLRSGEPTTRS